MEGSVWGFPKAEWKVMTITDIFICCTSVWQSNFVKAGYIIQVMTSAVKDKWGVDSSINLSPIKPPVQYKYKPLKHLLRKNRDAYEIRMQALKLLYLSLSWNGGFCFKFTNHNSRVKYRTHGLFCGNTSKVLLLFQDV